MSRARLSAMLVLAFVGAPTASAAVEDKAIAFDGGSPDGGTLPALPSFPPAPGVPDAGGWEWAVFPVLAGNTDIGFQFGAFAVLTKLGPPQVPYEWSLSGQLSTSVKGKPGGGLELPVHDDRIRFDWRSLDARWRVGADLWFWHAANAGFYGLGNASRPGGDPRATSLRGTQYLRSEVNAAVSAAWQPLELLRFRGGLTGRRLAPVAYDDSTLSQAVIEQPLVAGVAPHVSVIAAVSLELDTRDNELVPNRGLFLEAALRGAYGPMTGNDLTFGGTTLHLRGYIDPWPGHVVLAARLLIDTVFGNPPLHELSRSGGFGAVWMLGGGDGVRGVPEGRYQGRIKLTANLEARVHLVRFELFQAHWALGFTVFGDGGRVWVDWTPRPDLDGEGVGLHLSVGAGLRLRIGETILVRLDFAWAPPPASTANDPLGVYADLGQAF